MNQDSKSTHLTIGLRINVWVQHDLNIEIFQLYGSITLYCPSAYQLFYFLDIEFACALVLKRKVVKEAIFRINIQALSPIFGYSVAFLNPKM